MLKNRILAALSLVALLGAAACGGDDEAEEVPVEQAPAIERTSTDQIEVDSAVFEGAIIMDTTTPGAAPAPADTAR